MKKIRSLYALLAFLFLFVVSGADSATLFNYPKFKAHTSTGAPLSGGKLYTYSPGTTTPKATYSDKAHTTANANPTILDAYGEATIYTQGYYKFVLKTSAGTTLWTMDNITGAGSSVLDFSCISDYSNDLAAALTAIGSTPTTLFIDAAVTVSANATIPATISLHFTQPGAFTVNTGVTLTINAPITADKSQIFSLNGTGAVAINSTTPILSAWFGSTVAGMQKAADAAGAGTKVIFNKAASAYAPTAEITIDTNDNVIYEFESGFSAKMGAASANMFNISKNHITFIGNNAVLEGEGTYYNSDFNGKSLIISSGDYTIIRGFWLKEAENTFIRVEGDWNTIEDNLIEGGPVYATDPGQRSYVGIYLYGSKSDDATEYGSSYNTVRNNKIIPNASGGMTIEPIFGGHLYHPTMFNTIEGNWFEDYYDHCIYLIAEGTKISGNHFFAGGIKVQQRPFGGDSDPAYDTSTHGNVITGNIGDYLGGAADVLSGDACITLGSTINTVVSENVCKNYQNAALMISGTDDPYVFQDNKIINNVFDTVLDGDSTWACGIGINDTNLATFARNEFSHNTIRNIGDDTTGDQAGICIVNISNTNNHVGNKFDFNIIDTVQEQGINLSNLTGGSISFNEIRNIGVGAASAAIQGTDLREFIVTGNRCIGTGTQQTYGYEEDTSTSKRNRVTNNVFSTNATGMTSSLASSSYAKDNNNGSSNGEILAYNTAEDRTITAAELVLKTHLRDPNGSSRTDTTDTAANIIAEFLPNVGSVHEVTYVNTSDAAETITIAAGDSVIIYNSEGSGDAVIPAASAAILRFVRTGSGTVKVFVTVFEAV